MGEKVITAERAERQNRLVLRRIVRQVEEALREVVGISGVPTRKRIKDDLKFVMESAERHPEERFYNMGGFVVEVGHSSPWGDTLRVLVPATNTMFWYREDKD